MKLVVLGLTITSTWGNGHATTYRALLKALARRGHEVTFLERDVPWYASARDEPEPEGVRVLLYGSLAELDRHTDLVREADAVLVGSYVPDGKAVARWALRHARRCAFYDIDTPVTLAGLRNGECSYLDEDLLSRFDVVFSFSVGPVLDVLRKHGARRAEALPCGVDPDVYRPLDAPRTIALGYMGTYSADRMPGLERLLVEPARRRPKERFAVAGPQYPETAWPTNIAMLGNLPQPRHNAFYNQQRFTLNITRAAMVQAGHSPSVRLFEAAAAGTPIISDGWPGLEDVFAPGEEIVTVTDADDVEAALDMPDEERQRIADAARRRALRDHTADRRAQRFEEGLGLVLTM